MSVVDDVRILINDTGVFWPDQAVYDAINEAQIELLAETKWAVSTSTIVLPANTDIFTLPPAIMIPQHVESAGQRWHPTTQARLEGWSQCWRNEPNAQPQAFVLWDASHMRVFPKPDHPYIFQFAGIPWPTEVSAANPDVDASRLYLCPLTSRAAALLVEFTRPDLADAFNAQARDDIERYKRILARSQPHNIRRLRPGTVFTKINAGTIRPMTQTQATTPAALTWNDLTKSWDSYTEPWDSLQ